MDQVLVDASTVLFVYDLIEGNERPNAINLLDLSSLVESIILHENITILNSLKEQAQRDKLTAFVNSAGGNLLRVIERDAFDILEELQASRHNSRDDLPLQMSELFVDISSLDREVTSYLETLRYVFGHYWSHQRAEDAAAASSNALAPYATSPRLSLSVARFVRREGLLPDTVFNEWYLHGEGQRFNEFAEGSILRTQFYLCAAELFGMPYKADALRWPLCWNVLTQLPLAPMLEEKLLAQAVKTEVATASQLREVLGAGVIAVGLPLLLRTVLRESSNGSDVLKTALQIRSSHQAKKFRDFCRELREAIDEEDLRKAQRGLTEYTAELKRVFGESGKADVFWNLVESGVGIAKAGISLEAAIKSKGPIDELKRWWKRRRFALITKSLNQVGQTRALRSDVKRIFGNELADAELEILARLEMSSSN